MSQEFDPYLHWLGISKHEPRPLNYYRLLGVDKFESDADVIAINADKQIEHLRKFSSGRHGDLAEQMLTELTKAKLTLLKPERRAAYNSSLLEKAEGAASQDQASLRPASADLGTPRESTTRESSLRSDSTPPAAARVNVESDPAQGDIAAFVPVVPERVTPSAPVASSSVPEPSSFQPGATQTPLPPASYPPAPYPPPAYQPGGYQTSIQVSAPPTPQYSAPPQSTPPPCQQLPFQQLPVYYVQAPPLPYPPAYVAGPPLPDSSAPRQRGQHLPLVSIASPMQHVPVRKAERRAVGQKAAVVIANPFSKAVSWLARRLNMQQRGMYLSLIIGSALAIVVVGISLGIVIARSRMNPDEADPTADTVDSNTAPQTPPSVPEQQPPAAIAEPTSPQAAQPTTVVTD